MAEMPVERKDVPNTRNPKEVPLPADIAGLRKDFPNLEDARRLFDGGGKSSARDFVRTKNITPQTAVDQRHADLLKELRAKFEGKDTRTIEALCIINQTQAQLLRLQQTNDKTRPVPADEEKFASGREVIYTILPGLLERNFQMLDRYLVLKKMHAANGLVANPALEKAVQDQLKKFNDAAAVRLSLWGTVGGVGATQTDMAKVEKATEDLKQAINPLPVLMNELYVDFINNAMRNNNDLILKKASEYGAELKELSKKGSVSDNDKRLLNEKYDSQKFILQKQNVDLGVELESLLRHTGLENIGDVEELTIPEGQRQYQKPAAVEKAPRIPTAKDSAQESQKITDATVDALVDNFRNHFDSVLGPREGRPAKGYEKDHLLSTNRWDIRAEHIWTEKASSRAAMLLNLLAKYRGGIRSMVVNGPRKVAVGVARATAGDTVADGLDYTMKKVMSTKEASEYAHDHMAKLLKAMGLPDDFDLNSSKDWKDLDEDKRWPGAKAKHEKAMTSVKTNIEKFRKEVEGPAKNFEDDLTVLETLKQKTDPALLLGKKANPAMVQEFVKKGLTLADIAELDPKDAEKMISAYVALYLQMRAHWDAYSRAMGGLQAAVMDNITAHEDKADAANRIAVDQHQEDGDWLKYLVFAGISLYALGGRGGFARQPLGLGRVLKRVGNGLPSLADRVRSGRLLNPLGFFANPTKELALAREERDTLKKEGRPEDREKIAELEEKVLELEEAARVQKQFDEAAEALRKGNLQKATEGLLAIEDSYKGKEMPPEVRAKLDGQWEQTEVMEESLHKPTATELKSGPRTSAVEGLRSLTDTSVRAKLRTELKRELRETDEKEVEERKSREREKEFKRLPKGRG